MRKPIPGEPGEVDMMCAAARGALETACRCHGHFRGAIWGPLAYTNPVTVYDGLLLSAPKVPVLNSALPEECPVCLYRPKRIDGSALSGLDEAWRGAEPTPQSVQRCASPSVASLARWR